jgi:hypothetical protein
VEERPREDRGGLDIEELTDDRLPNFESGIGKRFQLESGSSKGGSAVDLCRKCMSSTEQSYTHRFKLALMIYDIRNSYEGGRCMIYGQYRDVIRIKGRDRCN